MNIRPMMSLTTATLALTALVGAGCSRPGGEGEAAKGGEKAAASQPAATTASPVRVATAKRETVTRAVPVTGSLAALQSVDLSPKLAARVVRVAGREGATIRAGEVAVQQDTSDFVVQLKQAQANLQAAQARLKQSQASLESAQVRLEQARTQAGLQVTTSDAGVRDAEQQVRSAQAQLELAKRPQRTQEIEVAENSVATAQANYDRAKSDRERYETLVKEGAAAQITLDQYVNQEKVAKANLDSAQKQLEIAREGGRTENVRNAETALARAQTQLRLAKANRAQVDVRRDDVKAAQAAVTQAEADIRASRATVAQNEATVANARLQIANASIVSPISGIISERLTEPGQQAAPGGVVLRVVALNTVFFEAQVPETELAAVKPGQVVTVNVDSFPGREFEGKIARVYPTGNTASRSVLVRVEIDNSGTLLRPGLYARGRVVAEQREGVVVPKDALVTRGDKTYVFVAANGGQASEREVRVGIRDTNTVEILSGVRAGEQVITAGQGVLKDGSPVQVMEEARQTAEL
jgi:HlyD family secretion protein